jgi:hypothetical protein
MLKVKCYGLNKIKALHVVNVEKNITMTTKRFSEESPNEQTSDRKVELDNLIL